MGGGCRGRGHNYQGGRAGWSHSTVRRSYVKPGQATTCEKAMGNNLSQVPGTEKKQTNKNPTSLHLCSRCYTYMIITCNRLKLLFLVRTPIQAFPWWTAFSGTCSFLPSIHIWTDQGNMGVSKTPLDPITELQGWKSSHRKPELAAHVCTGKGRCLPRAALNTHTLPWSTSRASATCTGHNYHRRRTPSEGRTVPRYLCASSERACVCSSGSRGVALSSARER